ncbi:uncharacterized protein LOC141903518 isoform X2 [Tubulanus polymorphus]|uniref:uncharacterized protein LOC141903518 isoform X2 n=1 Tax=Tubulanus polymorphus TaxID=672921 RepID=UPI003DA46FF6
MAVREGMLFGMGNPLLDISATLEEKDGLLEEYGLKPNDAILAEDKHVPMYKKIVEKYDVEYIPGGATQNSIKVAQWLLGVKNATLYMGSIGDDEFGKILADKTQELGVNTRYQINKTHATGTCAVLINGSNRSLCANLAAANHFTKDHLDDEKNQALLESALYYYIAGFFLTVSPETIMEVGKHACEKNKHFMMNLSAPFLCEFFKEPQMQAMPYVDTLFGNETEFLKFSEQQKFNTEDLKEIALKVAALPKKNDKRSRMVVITQGDKATIVAKDGEVKEFPVIKLAPEDIVDTNGAGDAFVGGFLAQLVQEKDLETCVKCGHYAANLIIQNNGCTMPGKPNFKC